MRDSLKSNEKKKSVYWNWFADKKNKRKKRELKKKKKRPKKKKRKENI